MMMKKKKIIQKFRINEKQFRISYAYYKNECIKRFTSFYKKNPIFMSIILGAHPYISTMNTEDKMKHIKNFLLTYYAPLYNNSSQNYQLMNGKDILHIAREKFPFSNDIKFDNKLYSSMFSYIEKNSLFESVGAIIVKVLSKSIGMAIKLATDDIFGENAVSKITFGLQVKDICNSNVYSFGNNMYRVNLNDDMFCELIRRQVNKLFSNFHNNCVDVTSDNYYKAIFLKMFDAMIYDGKLYRNDLLSQFASLLSYIELICYGIDCVEINLNNNDLYFMIIDRVMWLYEDIERNHINETMALLSNHDTLYAEECRDIISHIDIYDNKSNDLEKIEPILNVDDICKETYNIIMNKHARQEYHKCIANLMKGLCNVANLDILVDDYGFMFNHNTINTIRYSVYDEQKHRQINTINNLFYAIVCIVLNSGYFFRKTKASALSYLDCNIKNIDIRIEDISVDSIMINTLMYHQSISYTSLLKCIDEIDMQIKLGYHIFTADNYTYGNTLHMHGRKGIITFKCNISADNKASAHIQTKCIDNCMINNSIEEKTTEKYLLAHEKIEEYYKSIYEPVVNKMTSIFEQDFHHFIAEVYSIWVYYTQMLALQYDKHHKKNATPLIRYDGNIKNLLTEISYYYETTITEYEPLFIYDGKKKIVDFGENMIYNRDRVK